MQSISKDILILASEGDMEAFEKIYKATCGFVYSIALRIANNRSDAQEVTQDVFLKIYKNLKKFQFRSSFKTWVYRITTNTALNDYKRRSKEISRRGDYDIAIKFASVAGETEKAIDRENNQRLLESLLNMLNPDQRTCIMLREIEGLSYKEIAQILKINVNTVRSRLKRAREILLTCSKEGAISYEL